VWAAADRELGIARALSPNDGTVLFLSAAIGEHGSGAYRSVIGDQI
jgi:hypothetical protein